MITEKQGISSFYQTELDEYLQSNNIETVILCGVSTHFAVDATGKDAYQLGYQVVFLEDVMGAPIEQLHNPYVQYTFPQLGQVKKTHDII